MAYIYDLSDAWNAAGTTFTAIKMNVTNTASAAGSLLMDLQVGGVSRFNVSSIGTVQFANGPRIGAASGQLALAVESTTVPAVCGVAVSSGGVRVRTSGTFSWSFSTNAPTDYAADLILARDAANTLAQRNGVNAQTSRIYGTYTDASNYRRLTKTMSTAGVAEIKPEGAGTGASGNVLHISGLPTSNPGPGILWNNAGTPAIGT